MKHPLCILRQHRWGMLEGNAEGSCQRCLRCGKVKRASDGHFDPPIHRGYGHGRPR
jgi:hypothetical protein